LKEVNPLTLALLYDVARLLKKRLEHNSRGSGLTRSQWQILAYLAQNEGINQNGLAELLEIEPSTLGRILDKLETLGLIERHPHPTDRRTGLLHFVEAVHPKLEKVRELGDVTRSEALAGVSEADRQRRLKTLEAMKANDRSMRSADCRTKTSKPWLIEKIS
jgi:MarR family transcriptional regulator for hemolysin